MAVKETATNVRQMEERKIDGDKAAVDLRYPKSVAFIISNEFCERFNYYGLRTILVLYLTQKLHYDDDTSTVLFHVFAMLVYLFPLVGAIVADSWLGKFRTILYLSIVYTVGGAIVAAAAIPTLQLPVKLATIVGLLLIAIGTGGIKPCVSAFGGDQFRIPDQARHLATFFSLFYFAINAGSLISTSLTPILREDVHCFGEQDCYSLAFGVPALLMFVSVLIFVGGRRFYVMKPPAGNMIFGVSKCILTAIGGWYRHHRHRHRHRHQHHRHDDGRNISSDDDHLAKSPPPAHWLDYAEPQCGRQLVDDTRTLLKVLVLYLPFPVFWALFDQQSSRWVFQAARMDGELFGYNVKPDQMQVINPLLILLFIPLFDYALYPLLARIGIRRPLQKLTMGGLLAAVAFVISAFVEMKLDASGPQLPAHGMAQIRLYNGNPCAYKIVTDFNIISSAIDDGVVGRVGRGGVTDVNFANNVVDAFGFWQNLHVRPSPASQRFNHVMALALDDRCPNVSARVALTPGITLGCFLIGDQLMTFEDSATKPRQGDPLVRPLLHVANNTSSVVAITLRDASGDDVALTDSSGQHVLTMARGQSAIKVNGRGVAEITVKSGGVYALIIYKDIKDIVSVHMHTVIEANTVHMMWQLPQLIVITAAEIMFSITGLEFSFTQAPQSMKAVLQACWLLSVAIGNMLVAVVAEMKFFDSQAAEFFLFAVLMVVDMLIFLVLAMRYTYVHTETDDIMPEMPTATDSNGSINDEKRFPRGGQSNAAFNANE